MLPFPAPDPLVVLVTPVYNGAEFLEQTMECVQAQTYRNLVHYVLDNASTDATPAIIARFEGRGVRVISARNAATLPVIDNWNAALELIPPQTNYFRILSADDAIAPSYIEKMVAQGERHPTVCAIACLEKRGPILVGAGLPSDQTVLDGRAVIRRALLRKAEFPFDHCLYRYPSGGIAPDFFAREYYGTKLLCTDTDAAIRLISKGSCALVYEQLAMTRWPGSVTAAQMLPHQVGIWSLLQLIDRWGQLVFDTEAEYLSCRKQHLHYYYLHLLFWMARGQTELVALHQEWLRRASASPTTADYIRSFGGLHLLLARRLLRWAQRSAQFVQKPGTQGLASAPGSA